MRHPSMGSLAPESPILGLPHIESRLTHNGYTSGGLTVTILLLTPFVAKESGVALSGKTLTFQVLNWERQESQARWLDSQNTSTTLVMVTLSQFYTLIFL